VFDIVAAFVLQNIRIKNFVAKVKEQKMAKKIVLALVLAAAVAGGAFAQSANKKMSISLDLAPLFTGFVASEDTDTNKSTFFALSPVFEYAIGNYSIGARADLFFGSIGVNDKQSVTHIGLAAIGRWYPLAKLEKLYVGTELGFDTCTMEDVDDPLYTGLTFALRAGWKHFLGPVFLEPSLGYVVSKSTSASYMPLTPTGWEIGLNFGLAF
jgi:hypothetical protein